MAVNRWLDRTQPQTLVMATIVLYLNAALGLLYGAYRYWPMLVAMIAAVVAGWAIANEKKWGYWLGVALAVLAVGFTLWHFSAGQFINLIFYAALVALLLHPQSREYRRTWFR